MKGFVPYQDKPTRWCVIDDGDDTEDGRLIATDLSEVDAVLIARLLTVERQINWLKDEYRGADGSSWGEHPDYPLADWQHHVADNNTRQGYWEWVNSELEQAAADNE